MSAVKSFKAGLLKSIKRDLTKIMPYRNAHYWDIDKTNVALKQLETAKIVACGTEPYNVETIDRQNFHFGGSAGIAFMFEIDTRKFFKNNSDVSIPVIVHFIKDNANITEMNVWEVGGITGTINFLGTVILQDGDGEFKQHINRNKSFIGENGHEFTEIVNTLLAFAPAIAGHVAKYKIIEVADVSNTINMKKIPWDIRKSYNVYELGDSFNESYEQYLKAIVNVEDMNIWDDYTGPYSGFSKTLGMNGISDAKLIKYKYEGTRTPFDLNWLDTMPFSNFILASTSVDDVDELTTSYLHYNEGILNVMASTNAKGHWLNLARIDLNKWHASTPLFISPANIIEHKGVYTVSAEQQTIMIESLDQWIGAFAEFAFKYERLSPYVQNVNNDSLEIHTTNVVNNTSIYKIVVLGEAKKLTTSGYHGGKHSSPREHTRIGHKRFYKKSGKTIWVDEMIVNEGHIGKVHKEYHMKD